MHTRFSIAPQINYSLTLTKQLLRDQLTRGEMIAKMRSAIRETEEKTKSLIFDIINSDSLEMLETLAKKKSMLVSMKGKDAFDKRDIPVIGSMEKVITGSFKIFEENIEEIKNHCLEQIKETEAGTSGLINSLDSGNIDCTEKLLGQVLKNFETAMAVIVRNVELSIKSNKKCVNLNLNIPEKAKEGLSLYSEIPHGGQNNNVIDLGDWISGWWKPNGNEEVSGRKRVL